MTSDGARTTRAFGGYQPGLDGIRAFAVLGVLAYHADFAWAKGGYLGVSLFFTLSGFLITGILLDGLRRDDTIGLRRFWTRRFRRLAPAALIGLVMAVVYGATIATRSQAEDLPGEMLGALGYVVNWVFIGTEQSYTDIFAAPSPVQHYWSLGIEEQFYVVIPLALLGLHRLGLRGRGLGLVVAVAVAGAAAWMWWLHDDGASFERLYYGTDTRLTEVLVGAALAAVLDRRRRDLFPREQNLAGALGLLAFAVILWTWTSVELGDEVLWQGGLVGGAVLAAVTILGILSGRGPLPVIAAWGPLVWVGRLSYGIYVYHWFIFLWLTEERTDLGQWPLFVVRLALTVVVSWLSYRFVETPIREGRSFGLAVPLRLAAYPAAALVLVIATTVFVDESGDDPFATLRDEPTDDAPEPEVDPVLDVVLIAGADQGDVAAAMVARAEADDSLRVAATTLTCDPDPDSEAGGCANWAVEWPELVSAHDPDAVVFFVDDWPADTSIGDDGVAIGAALDQGFDLLTAGGAPVVWAASGADFATAFLRSTRPFTIAMNELADERRDVFSVLTGALPDPEELTGEAFVEASVDALLADAALHRRGPRLAPKVMVIGDSQGRSLGYGLERWSDANGTAWVWNRGSLGCGIADEGEVFGSGQAQPVRSECVGIVDEWVEQAAEFEPEVVVVFSSLWDLAPRRLADWDEPAGIGDAEFDAYLTAEYAEALAALRAGGARVVWIQPPCVETGANAVSADEVARLNGEILPAVVAGDDGARLFDLDAVLCVDGASVNSIDGVDDIRGDGVHFSVDGALWFADAYGAELLRLGGLET